VGSLETTAFTRVMSPGTMGRYAPPGYLLSVVDGTLLARRFDSASFQVTGDAVPLAEDVGFGAGGGYAAFTVSERGVLSYASRAASDTRLTWVTQTGLALGVLGPPGDFDARIPQMARGSL
jgi:hypothetical protein